MAKRYYVRYLESRDHLTISTSPTFVMTTSFDEGLRTWRSAGHRTKSDAVAWANSINAAAGKHIAEYAGAFEPTPQE